MKAGRMVMSDFIYLLSYLCFCAVSPPLTQTDVRSCGLLVGGAGMARVSDQQYLS